MKYLKFFENNDADPQITENESIMKIIYDSEDYDLNYFAGDRFEVESFTKDSKVITNMSPLSLIYDKETENYKLILPTDMDNEIIYDMIFDIFLKDYEFISRTFNAQFKEVIFKKS